MPLFDKIGVAAIGLLFVSFVLIVPLYTALTIKIREKLDRLFFDSDHFKPWELDLYGGFPFGILRTATYAGVITGISLRKKLFNIQTVNEQITTTDRALAWACVITNGLALLAGTTMAILSIFI